MKNSLHSNAYIMNNYNWALGNFGRCMDCSYVKYVFFVYCVIKRIVDHVPTLAVKQD